MRHNQSSLDRIVRFILGVALLALVVVGPKTPWGLLGLVPIVTALAGHCPLYRLLGIDACLPRQYHGE